MKKKLLLLLVFLFSAAGIILADSTTATRVRNFVNDKANTIPITASYMDSEFDNLITKANSKVLAKSTAPSSPTVGDTWCDTSVTPPFCKVYDGTTWAAMSFTKGADVASSTSMTLGNDGNFFDITGTTTITSITAKAAGFYACMQFDGALTVTDGSNLKLNGDLTTAAETVLCMVSDGTNWYETSRQPVQTLSLATAAEVKTGTDNAKYVSALAMIGHEGIIKGWCTFDGTAGTPACTDGYNVTTISDGGAGNYTINWDTDFGSANHTDVCSSTLDCMVIAKAAGTTQIYTDDRGGATLTDAAIVDIIAIGDR